MSLYAVNNAAWIEECTIWTVFRDHLFNKWWLYHKLRKFEADFVLITIIVFKKVFIIRSKHQWSVLLIWNISRPFGYSGIPKYFFKWDLFPHCLRHTAGESISRRQPGTSRSSPGQSQCVRNDVCSAWLSMVYINVNIGYILSLHRFQKPGSAICGANKTIWTYGLLLHKPTNKKDELGSGGEHMFHRTWSTLLQVMTCRLFGDKPLT